MLGRLDRCGSPPWALTHVSVQSKVWGHPLRAHAEEISDHVPVTVTVAPRAPKVGKHLPISKFLTRSARFQEVHDELVIDTGLCELPPAVRWQLHKEIIRYAASRARAFLFDNPPEDDVAKATILSTVARVVCRQDTKLA